MTAKSQNLKLHPDLGDNNDQSLNDYFYSITFYSLVTEWISVGRLAKNCIGFGIVLTIFKLISLCYEECRFVTFNRGFGIISRARFDTSRISESVVFSRGNGRYIWGREVQ